MIWVALTTMEYIQERDFGKMPETSATQNDIFLTFLLCTAEIRGF